MCKLEMSRENDWKKANRTNYIGARHLFFRNRLNCLLSCAEILVDLNFEFVLKEKSEYLRRKNNESFYDKKEIEIEIEGELISY